VAKDTDKKILARISMMEKEEGGLPLLLQFFRSILLVQNAALKHIGVPQVSLAGNAVRERMQQGTPLLAFNDLNIELKSARDTFVRVADTFAGYPGLFGEIPEKLRKPEAGRRLTRKAIEAWFTGEALPTAILNGTNETVLRAIINATMKPILAVYAEVLIKSVEQELWRRSYCPVCGGIPDIGFLEKERGARWLLCSRCDSEWLFQRLQCPYCGTQDPNYLAFFTDEEGLYQLNVCDKCRCYLKTIDLRKANYDVLVPLERLLTTEMDRQAREKGYSLPV
jgi:FdhE protein